ncbi:MAG: DUF3298 and DUF4163 domain-containing protein [Deltaproteobacteria bacterium]|jgi:hypothetical protein|nr:DUF3298 and DUF4163 domain-containing protein [Deltaproteobacteria bacterium]
MNPANEKIIPVRWGLFSGLLILLALFFGNAPEAAAKTTPARQNQNLKQQTTESNPASESTSGQMSGKTSAQPLVAAPQAALATRSLMHKDERCSVMVNYPQVGNSKIDAELDYWAGKTVSTFVAGAASLSPKGVTRFSMLVDYEFSESSDNFLSIVFRINTETGGPHPDPGMVAFTYDLSDGRKLDLQDLFSNSYGLLDFISAYAYENLLDKLGPEHENSIKQGTGGDPVNFSLFALRPDGLVFYFPPYQVAAYELGEQQVTIGLDKLERFKPRSGVWNNKSAAGYSLRSGLESELNHRQARLGLPGNRPQ